MSDQNHDGWTYEKGRGGDFYCDGCGGDLADLTATEIGLCHECAPRRIEQLEDIVARCSLCVSCGRDGHSGCRCEVCGDELVKAGEFRKLP